MIECLNSSKTYFENFKIAPEACNKRIPVERLSVRSRNCLVRQEIMYFNQLLALTPDELLHIRSLGTKSFDEISKMILQFVASVSDAREEDNYSEFGIIIPHIKNNDYSFIDTPGIVPSDVLNKYLTVEETLGREYIREFVCNQDFAQKLHYLTNIVASDLQQKIVLDKSISKIPLIRKRAKVSTLLDLFYKVDPVAAVAVRRFLLSEDETMVTFCDNVTAISIDVAIINFIEWASFNTKQVISQCCNDILGKYRPMIESLANGETLESAGAIFGVTRERIRQIKVKVTNKFLDWTEHNPIIGMISVDLGSSQIIKTSDIYELIDNDDSAIIIYLLKQDSRDSYIYNKDFDAFILDWDPDKGRDIERFINTLPKYLTKQEFENILLDKSSEYDAAILRQYMGDIYEAHGNYYFKGKTSASDRCEIILREYYPNGIHVYSDNELEKFTKYYVDLFNEMPSSNRALAARIMSVGILCDRGTYKIKQASYISTDLKNKIHTYIDSIDQPIFVVGDLFDQFSCELCEEGITNKYFLQAILQDVFSDKYRTKRNFLFKDANAISIYDEVTSFIESSNYPVSLADIRNSIIGVNNIYINWAIAADSNVLNLFGEYYHSSHLDISDFEVSELHRIVESILSDCGIHHVKDMFPLCEISVPYALKRNYIKYPFSLFSLLSYLFDGEYQFVRPFIAHTGVSIDSSKEMMRSSIYEYDEISIDGIRNIAGEIHYTIYSLIEFLDGCNDKYLIADNETIMCIEKTGITEDLVYEIENMIYSELSGTIKIRELKCFHSLPKISIPWSDWLVYSVIKKWSTKLDVSITNSQFRYAIPVVSRKGELDISSVQCEDVSQGDYNLGSFDEIDLDLLLAEEAEEELKNEFQGTKYK